MNTVLTETNMVHVAGLVCILFPRCSTNLFVALSYGANTKWDGGATCAME